MDEKGLVWSIKERERERLPRNVIYIPDSMVLVLLFRWMEMRRVAILWLTSEGIRCVVRPFNTFETPFWLCQLLLRLNTRLLLRRKPSLKKFFSSSVRKTTKMDVKMLSIQEGEMELNHSRTLGFLKELKDSCRFLFLEFISSSFWTIYWYFRTNMIWIRIVFRDISFRNVIS